MLFTGRLHNTVRGENCSLFLIDTSRNLVGGMTTRSVATTVINRKRDHFFNYGEAVWQLQTRIRFCVRCRRHAMPVLCSYRYLVS